MTVVLHAQSITIRYPHSNTNSFENFSCIAHDSQVIAIIGNNGTGKSTLLKALYGLIPIKAGAITRNYRSVGFMPEQCMLNPTCSAYDFLYYNAQVQRIPHARIKHTIVNALEQVELSDIMHTKIRTFSKGMRHKLCMAQLLLQKHDLILLDEPFTGLDEHATALMRTLFFCGYPGAIIYSTHMQPINRDHTLVYL
jgi:ABC-type multidrug transport system ATPase subunit